MALTRTQIKQLRDVLNIELAKVGKQFGMTFELGNCRFGETDGHFTGLKFTEATNKSGNTVSPSAAEFLKYASMLGLSKTDLGKVVRIGSRNMKIVGARMSAHKYPVIGQDMGNSGKRFKLTAEQVKQALLASK